MKVLWKKKRKSGNRWRKKKNIRVERGDKKRDGYRKKKVIVWRGDVWKIAVLARKGKKNDAFGSIWHLEKALCSIVSCLRTPLWALWKYLVYEQHILAHMFNLREKRLNLKEVEWAIIIETRYLRDSFLFLSVPHSVSLSSTYSTSLRLLFFTSHPNSCSTYHRISKHYFSRLSMMQD